jgi:hypothetical protein
MSDEEFLTMVRGICPASDKACAAARLCEERRLCVRLHARPIDLLDATPAVHFVGFRGEEYRSAVRAFGLPDFIHRGWDRRAQREIASCDTVVFARFHDQEPSQYNYDDSNEPDDPAAKERLGLNNLRMSARVGSRRAPDSSG